ncbi:BTB/POZ [Kalmanozyma brasiliensis GHG001]|uniref:BTB/POZ n=1 Tax=Kalmanozyma brasiliensis (strain GHG001) TaxID=1365824 RepID=UPI0028682854|nr:BTB/POZ [Kalmanozyma brasiliensis GHG001]EST05022.2 BTB/POZ [Kalmanozyma brasiliensis GHG001]
MSASVASRTPQSGAAAPMRPVPSRGASVRAHGSDVTAHAQAGPSKGLLTLNSNGTKHNDPVRAAQEEATKVWKADMRRLLDRAEERFADVCWTTATTNTQDHRDEWSPKPGDEDRTSLQTAQHALIPTLRPTQTASIPTTSTSQDTLIWAHKAILYARAPNTFHARFLKMRSPAHQLQHIGSTASLASLPLHRSGSQLSLASDLSRSNNTDPSASNANTLTTRGGIVAKARQSIRGTAPPSSFSMKKPSLRKPISRSSISRPLRKGSIDEANSIASGFATSDSEGEGDPTYSLRASRLINTRSNDPKPHAASLTSSSKIPQESSSALSSNHPTRKPSFASVTSAADSQFTDAPTVVSDASTLRAPISLGDVSQAFFEATLQYLYTGEEAMVDAFEFLFENRLASDSEVTAEQKLDKLRTDLTFMWRSKLYSDVKIVLAEDDDDDDSDDLVKAGLGNGRKGRDTLNKMMDIPDANMSVLSLAPTLDTERCDNSDNEDDDLTSFSTHRMILASRSQYFASMLLSPYADSRAPVLHLPSPPFTPASLHFTLGFLYTGTLFFSNRTFDLSTAFSLWRAGAYLQIETLQALVVALIDREFCHGFHCSPPCRKCAKRVPRTLSFATSPDVSERSLQEPAIAAVSGVHFGMYWAKEVGSLDSVLQDRIVDSITDCLRDEPTLVVSVLRQLSIVGQRIDTERSSRWVESLRVMAETVESRLMRILHSDLEKIVQSQAFSDLLDGVGSLGDVLEKFLVMLIDGLTEARAADIYQLLVGQVLLRDQGFEVGQSRQAVETARASILRYLKKRWINVRALAGFNKLEKWCLKELADELDVTTADLVLTEGPSPAKLGLPPSRLMATRRTSSLAGSIGANGAVGASLAAARSSMGARSSLSGAAAAASRMRTASAASTASSLTRTASPARDSLRDDGEREAGPIHMRAAVLNRNAARTSVANGHRSLSTASTASTTSPATRPSSRSVATASLTPATRAKTSHSPASKNGKATNVHAAATAEGINGTGVKINSPSPVAVSKEQRARTPSSASTATLANGKAVRPAPAEVAAPRVKAASVSTRATTSSKADRSPTPKSSTVRTPSAETDQTPTKTIRNVRSAASLSSRTSTNASKPAASSLDTKPTKPPVLGHKSSFLRATPGPGGTFSLSTTDSGYGLRPRTVSNASAPKKTAAATTASDSDRARSVTPTKPTARRTSSTSSSPKSSKTMSVAEAMPADALTNVQRARQASSSHGVRKSESVKTIVLHSPTRQTVDLVPSRTRETVTVDGGISLIVGIPCIVALNFKSPSAPGAGVGGRKSLPAPQQRKAGAATAARSASSTTGGAGATRKFRAQVRYLGLVAGHPGVWVGVTLHLPPHLVAAITPPPLKLRNGGFQGTQYYRLDEQAGREAVEAQERMDRRREVWERVSPNMPFPTPIERRSGEEKAKGKAEPGPGPVELFVRPSEIVWVVQ